MEQMQITSELTSIFRKIFNDQSIEIKNAMTADDVDGWDSLSHMILITEIEDHFSIKFKLRELNKMNNVGKLIELIELKTS